jgi:FkbM family methyltransferase
MIVSLQLLIKKLVFSLKSLGRPSVAFCAKHALIPSVFVRTPGPVLRDLFQLPASRHESQLNQEAFALLMNRFRKGFFVEVGANDGFTLSNTVYLEEQFGWQGLLVEANPEYLGSLKHRKSKSVIAAVVDQEGYYEFCNAGLYGGVTSLLDKTYEKITKKAGSLKVWGTTLERILKENGAPEVIDFISIDVEGAEVLIVEQMCRIKDRRFACGCIEYNSRQADYNRIARILVESGYSIVWEGQTLHDLFFVDKGTLEGSG